jgi:hypothetical protein
MTTRVGAVARCLRAVPALAAASALSASIGTVATRANAETAPPAHAVLVIGGGAQFRDAMKVALSPWQLRVVPLDSAPPRPVMPHAADEARALAQQYGATGLVWVAMEQSEPSLWVYDAATDQVVTRKTSTTPPFDAPTAAAAALTVKTLLRASTVAPVEERIGAPAASGAPGEPAAGASGSVHDARNLQSPGEGRDSAAEVGAEARDRAAGERAPRPDALLRAELEAQGRTLASTIDTRVSAGASVWLGAQRRLGLALAASFGPGLSVSEARFSGRFSEVGVAPSIRLRVPISRRLVLEPRVGSSLHATSIDGVAVVSARPASTSRLDGSVDAALALDVLVTPTLGLAVDGGVSAMLRYQRYIVESESIFELRPVQGFLGLRLTTSLL